MVKVITLTITALALQSAIAQEPAVCIEMSPPKENCEDACEILEADRAFNARAQESFPGCHENNPKVVNFSTQFN